MNLELVVNFQDLWKKLAMGDESFREALAAAAVDFKENGGHVKVGRFNIGHVADVKLVGEDSLRLDIELFPRVRGISLSDSVIESVKASANR